MTGNLPAPAVFSVPKFRDGCCRLWSRAASFLKQHILTLNLRFVIKFGLHAGALGAEAVHLMAICELDDSFTPADSPMTQQTSSQRSRAYFGFAFLDAAAGRFFVGTASDDAARANLGAIITQVSTTADCSY